MNEQEQIMQDEFRFGLVIGIATGVAGSIAFQLVMWLITA